MKSFRNLFLTALSLALLGFSGDVARAADVRGYSIIKGQFLNQTGPDTLVLDPDFGFSILASVDLTDFYLVTNATFRLPNGTRKALEDIGDYWGYLDQRSTLASLNSAYPWGSYTLDFATVHEGTFSCPLNLPDTPLPPTPRLTNFADIQAVNPAKPLTLYWDFSAPPNPGDFVQVYIDQGHANVFATPEFGEPGALDAAARSVTVPANLLDFGVVYSLNLEITRVAGTNSVSYPAAEGASGTLRSTSLALTTLLPSWVQLLAGPTNGLISLQVEADPGTTIIVQGASDLAAWKNLATNAEPSGTNVFSIKVGSQPVQFFRAWQP